MHPMRILIAEDDADHRKLLERALACGRPHVEIVVASNRQDVIAALESSVFDCIVLDFNIPPDTAPDLIPHLRESLPDTPILVVSSSEDQRVVVESLRHGVADFVHKDAAISSDALWERIEAAVTAARQRMLDRRVQARRLRHLHREACTDPLTGLHNRRHAERLLVSERAAHDRRCHTAVLMMDLDRFKSINDSYGHFSGDLVLKAAAGMLRQHSRRADTIARWGGEEFMLLRASPSPTEAWAWADSIRRSLAALVIPVDGCSVQVTASFGVTVVPTDELRERGVIEADRALYLAKDLGRNRVCSWPMVCAVELAERAQSMPYADERSRLCALRDAMLPGLRETQIQQIVAHGVDVQRLTIDLANIMMIDHEALQTLALAAEFHDLGKAAIPEEILAAQRALNDMERRFINEHARFGADLIRAAGVNERVARLVERHHERYDNQQHIGLGNTRLPIDTDLVMILTLADSVVAMTADRPYTVRKSVLQALAEARLERGGQFAPDVVDALHRLHHTTAQAA